MLIAQTRGTTFSSAKRGASMVLACLVFCALAISAVGVASAATPMYVLGKYTQVSFGNDTTTGTTSPFYSTNYLGIPFGQDCNAQHGSRIAPSTPTLTTGGLPGGGTTSLPTGYQCFATSSYPSAHAGSPLVGTGIISVSASPGGAIALPQSLVSVKLGTFPTAFSVPTPPFTANNFAKKPVGGVPGGSFSYYPPYIYSYSYADLKNAAGNFFAGGGPGNFTHAATAGGVAAGTLTTTTGGAKFGGTMGLLGRQQTHFAYSNSGLSVGTDPWLISWLGNGTVNSVTGAVGVLTTMSTGTNKNTLLLQTNTNYITASALPWSTGAATARATRGPFFTNFARSGYDNRTAAGAGNIQLVSPMLTHWRTPAGDVDYETGAIGQLTLTFAPEPSSAMLLVAGVSLLGLVYRSSRGA